MFDPAALGTLLIGLDAIEAEGRADARPRRRLQSRRDGHSVRLAIASGLRRAAAALEGPVREPAR